MVCPPVREIIHSLKLMDYLPLQADTPWYNCYIMIIIIMGEFKTAVSVQGMEFWLFNAVIRPKDVE